jgi:hypothetical protein
MDALCPRLLDGASARFTARDMTIIASPQDRPEWGSSLRTAHPPADPGRHTGGPPALLIRPTKAGRGP